MEEEEARKRKKRRERAFPPAAPARVVSKKKTSERSQGALQQMPARSSSRSPSPIPILIRGERPCQIHACGIDSRAILGRKGQGAPRRRGVKGRREEEKKTAERDRPFFFFLLLPSTFSMRASKRWKSRRSCFIAAIAIKRRVPSDRAQEMESSWGTSRGQQRRFLSCRLLAGARKPGEPCGDRERARARWGRREDCSTPLFVILSSPIDAASSTTIASARSKQMKACKGGGRRGAKEKAIDLEASCAILEEEEEEEKTHRRSQSRRRRRPWRPSSRRAWPWPSWRRPSPGIRRGQEGPAARGLRRGGTS